MNQDTNMDYRRLMTKMVNVIAHDVRNPLNNILLSTAQFKGESLPDKEDTAFYIDIIERSCDRVNSLLEEIIGIIHPPGLNPDTFDLTEVVKELLQENEDRLELKEVKVVPTLNEVVVAHFDRAMVKQALFHVLENAIDASGKGMSIAVSVQQDGDTAKIIIADEGGGINEDTMPHIYAPFYTSKERHKGLGLALADNVIAAHLGSMRHTNTEKGTEVVVSMPLHV
ncbi:MAG: HAMP domain-containing histidine kinase [Chitinophagaceae bacterium]|nr:MAG: HAMP domain-containing histidine kinase [Chitinophagaceae bacterium]